MSGYIEAEYNGEQVLESINYRNLAPLYCDEKMRICGAKKKANEGGYTYDVWIEGPAGGVAVRGTVQTVTNPLRNRSNIKPARKEEQITHPVGKKERISQESDTKNVGSLIRRVDFIGGTPFPYNPQTRNRSKQKAKEIEVTNPPSASKQNGPKNIPRSSFSNPAASPVPPVQATAEPSPVQRRYRRPIRRPKGFKVRKIRGAVPEPEIFEDFLGAASSASAASPGSITQAAESPRTTLRSRRSRVRRITSRNSASTSNSMRTRSRSRITLSQFTAPPSPAVQATKQSSTIASRGPRIIKTLSHVATGMRSGDLDAQAEAAPFTMPRGLSRRQRVILRTSMLEPPPKLSIRPLPLLRPYKGRQYIYDPTHVANMHSEYRRKGIRKIQTTDVRLPDRASYDPTLVANMRRQYRRKGIKMRTSSMKSSE